MRIVFKVFQTIYAIYAMLFFVAGLFIIFPFVLLAVLLGQPHGGNLVLTLCRLWSDGWLFCIGVWHRNIIVSPIRKNEHYVFVANHISYMDIPLIFQAIRRKHFRVLGKIEMSKIPVFGVLYKLVVVLIDRSNPKSRARSIEKLLEVLGQNISIFIFPEGTFNESKRPLKAFYDGAFRIAIETQTPIKPIVFLDAINRIHYRGILAFSPGRSRAVHLPPIPVAGLTLEDVATLKKTTHDIMESCIIEYGGHYK